MLVTWGNNQQLLLLSGSAAGPELNPDVPFAVPASWSKNNLDSGGSVGITVAGGKGNFAAPGDACLLGIPVGAQPAGIYTVSVDIDSGGTVSVGCGSTAISFVAGSDATTVKALAPFAGAGAGQTGTFTANVGFSWLLISAGTGVAVVDNVSLKKTG